jgi:hypothetical protein
VAEEWGLVDVAEFKKALVAGVADSRGTLAANMLHWYERASAAGAMQLLSDSAGAARTEADVTAAAAATAFAAVEAAAATAAALFAEESGGVVELGTVRGFGQNSALEDAIGSHACSLEASMRVTKDIPLGSPHSYQLTL